MTDGSMRSVTFLLTDIEGSTQLLARTGARYPALLEHHRAVIGDVARRHGGTAHPMEGDSCLATFDSPDAAVRAAVDMQRALGRGNRTGQQVRVRIGVHCGQGVRRHGEWFGLDLHRAARITAAGHGGQVLVSAAVRAALRDTDAAVSFRDLGLHRLKDLDEPVQLLQVTADGLAADFPPLRTPRGSQHSLPVPTTPLVGRRDDVEAVTGLLRGHRLVTLTGPGGVGKSRLAQQIGLEAAADHADGVRFVELARVGSAAQVPALVAAALDVPLSGGGDAAALVGEALRAQSLLLILDNFEHAVDAAPLVSRLLGAAARLHVLVTSRQRLQVAGEHVYDVAPLALPAAGRDPATADAVALFVERARALHPSFAPGPDELADIAAITRLLDGLPLAIELAAAQIRVLSVGRIRSRMGSALDTLGDAGRDRPARHRSLRETIAWSYRSLPADEQRLFMRLSVFQAPATIDTIRQVCMEGLDLDVVDGIAALVDKSLLQRRIGGDGEWSFQLLQLLREFAADALTRSGDADAVAARHARFLLHFAEPADDGLLADDAEAWEDHLNLHLADIRAALSWAFDGGDALLGARVVAALALFWYWGGPHDDGRDWLRRASGVTGIDDAVRSRLDLGLGFFHYGAGDLQLPRSHWERALAGFRRVDDRARTALALGLVALTHADGAAQQRPGMTDEAAHLIDEALRLAQDSGHPRVTADVWNLKGELARLRGDDETARRCYAQAVELVAPTGNLRFLARLHANLAFLAGHAGDHAAALQLLHRALDASSKRGHRVFIAWTLGELAGPEAGLGRPERAARLIGASDAALARFGVARQPADQPEHAATLARLEVTLGPAALQRLRAEGARLSVEEAVAFAHAPAER